MPQLPVGASVSSKNTQNKVRVNRNGQNTNENKSVTKSKPKEMILQFPAPKALTAQAAKTTDGCMVVKTSELIKAILADNEFFKSKDGKEGIVPVGWQKSNLYSRQYQALMKGTNEPEVGKTLSTVKDAKGNYIMEGSKYAVQENTTSAYNKTQLLSVLKSLEASGNPEVSIECSAAKGSVLGADGMTPVIKDEKGKEKPGFDSTRATVAVRCRTKILYKTPDATKGDAQTQLAAHPDYRVELIGTGYINPTNQYAKFTKSNYPAEANQGRKQACITRFLKSKVGACIAHEIDNLEGNVGKFESAEGAYYRELDAQENSPKLDAKQLAECKKQAIAIKEAEDKYQAERAAEAEKDADRDFE